MARRPALEASHFPAGEASVDELERLPHAGAAAADLRGVLPLPDRPRLAAPRRRASSASRTASTVDDRIRQSAARVLPFHLTPGQRTATKEIVDDLCLPTPMHRLLQGDVGAGKTIVALLAAVVAMENGLQVAFMAPTEILAKQHYATHGAAAGADALPRGPADRQHAGPAAAHHPGAPRARHHATWWSARTRWCRTPIKFHELGLVVIDEQHRFGVAQRAALQEKGLRPDVLLMTATPIPRTLALTDYSELDVSKITGLPPGRQAGAHVGEAGIAPRRGLRADARASSTRAGRSTSSIRWSRSRRRST